MITVQCPLDDVTCSSSAIDLLLSKLNFDIYLLAACYLDIFRAVKMRELGIIAFVLLRTTERREQ